MLLDDRVLRQEDGPLNIPAGGLSEIAAMKPVGSDGLGSFVMISDDRGNWGPPRALRMDLRFDMQQLRFHVLDRQWLWLTRSHEPDVTVPAIIDGEALRYDRKSGRLIWSSEGAVNQSVPPGVYETDLTGRLLRQIALPAHVLPDPAKKFGVRANKAFEAMDLSADGRFIVLMNEFSLSQDEYPGFARQGPLLRVITIDRALGQVQSEHSYRLDLFPTPREVGGDGGTAGNGAVSLLLLGDGRYLVLERGFSPTLGARIYLYLADPTGADDLMGHPEGLDETVRPASKQLIADLLATGLRVDNWEGMAFGPDLPDGRKTLILVSDDNFNRLFQSTIIAWIALPPLD